MKKLMPWIRSGIFLLLLAVILSGCKFIFAQTGYVRFIMNEAESKETNYDTIILGASHCRGAINPAKLDERLHTNGLNMAIPGETVEDSYYILKDVADDNDIKTVILDVDYQYWMWEQPTTHFTRSFIYQQLKNPEVKMEYLFNNRDVMDMRNLLASRLSWDVSVSGVKRNIAVKTSAAYKNNDIESAYGKDGFVEGADGPYVGKGFFDRQGTEYGKLPPGEDYVQTWVGRSDDNLDENVKTVFRKMARYCKDKGIRLVCVTSPITPTIVKTLRMEYVHETLSQFITGECNVEYYDFNNAKMSFIPRSDCDYGDQEGHMGGTLGNVYSEALAIFLEDVADGSYNKSDYFYDTFEDFYNNMAEDYTKVTGLEWRGL